MRLSLVFTLLLAGCSFRVSGVDLPTPAAPLPTPPQTSPPPSNAATPPPVDAAVPPPATSPADLADPTTPLGGACADDTRCDTGLFCAMSIGNNQSTLMPGGYCTVACTGTTCPMGSSCMKYMGQSLCLLNCDPNASVCRQGYSCCGSGKTTCAPTSACNNGGGLGISLSL